MRATVARHAIPHDLDFRRRQPVERVDQAVDRRFLRGDKRNLPSRVY
jgi:hypothetical protein